MKNEVLDMKEELIEVLIRQRNLAHEEIAKLEGGTDAPATTPEDADLTKTEAKNLLAQADSLEEQAKTMRENAYQMDESLRPKRGRPAGTKKS